MACLSRAPFPAKKGFNLKRKVIVSVIGLRFVLEEHVVNGMMMVHKQCIWSL